MYFLRIFSTISSSDIVTSPSEEWFQREFQQRYLQVSIQHVLLYTYFFENLFIEASRDSIRNTTRFFFLWLLQDILKKFHSSWNKSTGFYGFFFRNYSWHSFRISLGNAFKEYYRSSCLYCFMCFIRPHFWTFLEEFL